MADFREIFVTGLVGGLCLLIVQVSWAEDSVMSSECTSQPRDPARARSLFEKASSRFADARARGEDKSEFGAACELFEESLCLDRTPGVLRNLGNCRREEGKLATAHSHYLAAAELAEDQGNLKFARATRGLAASIAAFRSFLVIQVDSSVAGLKVRLDETLIGRAELSGPLPIDPGEHVVAASAPGYVPIEKHITIGPLADNQEVTLPELEPLPPPPPRPPSPEARLHEKEPLPHLERNSLTIPAATPTPTRKSQANAWPWVLGGVGATALSVGALGAIVAVVSQHSASQCASRIAQGCTDKNLWRTESRRDLATNVAWIGVPIGVVTLGASAWMLLDREKQEPPARRSGGPVAVSIEFRGSQLWLDGSF